jgi:hypothetical protein
MAKVAIRLASSARSRSSSASPHNHGLPPLHQSLAPAFVLVELQTEGFGFFDSVCDKRSRAGRRRCCIRIDFVQANEC